MVRPFFLPATDQFFSRTVWAKDRAKGDIGHMGKPWARYEVGFIDHDKFKALPAAAICLWIQGKNYADEKLTDGLLPRRTVEHFRFYSKKNLDLLTKSAGPKPAQPEETYAPLWEPHALGWKMHDYLQHNQCRDEVLQRLQDADERRQLRQMRNKDRQQRHRDKRREEMERLRSGRNAGSNALRNAQKSVSNALLSGPTDPDPDPDLKILPRDKHASPPERPKQPTKPAFEAYQERFIAKYGGKPEYSREKDPGRMRNLLEKHGLEEVIRRLTTFFASTDPWIQRSGHTLDVFFAAGTQTKLVAERGGGAIAGAQRVNGCFHKPPCADPSAHSRREVEERDAAWRKERANRA